LKLSKKEIKQYLQRINFDQPIDLNIDCLSQLQAHHLLAVPFENLDIHNNHSISLEPNSIFNKIVVAKRGGFCYELNGSFGSLLNAIGFEVNMVSAQVYSEDTNIYSPEYDHLALIVEIDQFKYIVDVGFGEFAFHPIQLETDQIYIDPHGSYRVQAIDKAFYRVDQLKDDRLIPQYKFSLKNRELDEFGPRCTFHQTDPQSHFMKKAMISIPTINGRVTLSSDALKIKKKGLISEHEIVNQQGFDEALKEYFDIEL